MQPLETSSLVPHCVICSQILRDDLYVYVHVLFCRLGNSYSMPDPLCTPYAMIVGQNDKCCALKTCLDELRKRPNLFKAYLLSQSEMQNALLARFLRWSPVALHRNEGVFAKRQNTCGKEKQSGNEKKSARPAMNMNIFMSSSTNHKLQMRSSPAIECVLCV